QRAGTDSAEHPRRVHPLRGRFLNGPSCFPGGRAHRPAAWGPRLFVATRDFGEETMDTAAHAIAPHGPDALRVLPTGQTLAVSATYQLSEAGRKASLIAGGDGKGVQRLTVQVPTARLHLVTVG